MIVYKVKKIKGVHLEELDKDLGTLPYTLHVLKFGDRVRVFLEGQMIAYEVENERLVISEIVGLLTFLSGQEKTAKWYFYNDVEIVKPRWFHAFPRVTIEKR